MVERMSRTRVTTMTATLGMILLGSQLCVTFLCVLAIVGLKVVPMELGLWAGGGILLFQLVAIAVLKLTNYTWLGWVVELISVAAGFLQPAMFIVGGMFLAAWIYCMIQGKRIDAERAPLIAEYERALAEGASEEEAAARAREFTANRGAA